MKTTQRFRTTPEVTAEIASGDRLGNEWYGQCVSAAGGSCRNNDDPATKSRFRGRQVYFGGADAGAGN